MIYFLSKTATWSHARGSDYNAIPLLDWWICSPSIRKSYTAAALGVLRPNQDLPTWGRLVTSATIGLETSIRNPLTSEWVSLRFKENYRAVSRWNPFRRWKNSVQPVASKIAKNSALFLSSRIFGGSCWDGIPLFVWLQNSLSVRQITGPDNGG